MLEAGIGRLHEPLRVYFPVIQVVFPGLKLGSQLGELLLLIIRRNDLVDADPAVVSSVDYLDWACTEALTMVRPSLFLRLCLVDRCLAQVVVGKLFEAVDVLRRTVIQHRQVIEEILVALGIWNGTSGNEVTLRLLLG